MELIIQVVPSTHRCLHTDDKFFLKSMREAIHEILTDVSDSFSNMIDMALANEIRVTIRRSPDLFLLYFCLSCECVVFTNTYLNRQRLGLSLV